MAHNKSENLFSSFSIIIFSFKKSHENELELGIRKYLTIQESITVAYGEHCPTSIFTERWLESIHWSIMTRLMSSLLSCFIFLRLKFLSIQVGERNSSSVNMQQSITHPFIDNWHADSTQFPGSLQCIVHSERAILCRRQVDDYITCNFLLSIASWIWMRTAIIFENKQFSVFSAGKFMHPILFMVYNDE